MKYSLSTDHIQLNDADIKALEEKMERLEKWLKPPFTVDVSIKHDKHHRSGDVIGCRINVQQAGKVYYAERKNSTVKNAVDRSVAAIKKELNKDRDKKKRRRWFR